MYHDLPLSFATQSQFSAQLQNCTTSCQLNYDCVQHPKGVNVVSEFLHTEIENNQSFNFCTSVHTCFSNPRPKEFLLKVHTPYKMQVEPDTARHCSVNGVCTIPFLHHPIQC